MLQVSDLEAGYGDSAVLHGVELVVRQGEIVALIGANGAGKTTLLKAISGLIKPTRGVIAFAGVRIDRRPPHRIVAMGISQVAEGRAILRRMSVLENLRMGAYCRRDGEVESDLQQVMTRFPILAQRRKQLADTLSGGEQQMLAIGRALMARPRLLLLDEPSLGLAPLVVKQIFHALREVKDDGTTVLLVEQNARQALQLGNRGYVLERGRITLEGTGDSLLNNPEVQRTYLGRRRHDAGEGAG